MSLRSAITLGLLLAGAALTAAGADVLLWAEFGISIRDRCAPKLDDVSFARIGGGRHIYLDSADVFLPVGLYPDGHCAAGFQPSPGTWDLAPGTNVVAANAAIDPDREAAIGTPGKVDLIVDAKLTAIGSGSDSVTFRPEFPNDGAGDEWGGLTVSSYAVGTVLDTVQISHAANPLFLHYADSTLVANTTVHHFKETGIWVKGGGLTIGAEIKDVLVDRGAGLLPANGDVGVLLDEADNVEVVDCGVNMTGLAASAGGTGIRTIYGKTFCGSTPWGGGHHLRVQECSVTGPGTQATGDDYIGVEAIWLCGSEDREFEFLRNGVYDWEKVGMEFYQSADAQVTCNRVVGSPKAVDVYRDHEPTGTSLRFKYNVFEAIVPDSANYAFRTNDAIKAKLGPSNFLRGDNRLVVSSDSTKFIFEVDGDTGDELDATNNYWYIGSSLVSTSSAISAKLAPPGYEIDFSGFYDQEINVMCDSIVPPPLEAHGGSVSRLLQAGAIEEWPPARERTDGPPTVLELGVPYPNPGRQGVSLDLTVPEGATGEYVLEVFDVGGRRVLRSVREVVAAGRYTLEWSGAEQGGNWVGAGVYFIRLKGPGGFQQLRKITVVRWGGRLHEEERKGSGTSGDSGGCRAGGLRGAR
jgi:hypothetical protein